MTETTPLTASVYGKDLSISKKHAVEICARIRGKTVKESKAFLQKVIAKKTAVPFTRFNRDMGHKPGHTGPGRYPLKASTMLIQLLNSLEANAQNKGMDVNSLRITTIIANKAHTPWHLGRFRRRKMKRAHIKIVAEEKKGQQRK